MKATMNRFVFVRRFAILLAAFGLVPVVAHRATAEELSFDVDGIFSVTDSHGSQLSANVEGTLELGNGESLDFSIDAHVKHTGNHIEGTPAMVFDNGDTLTFYYEIKLDKDTGIYEGDFLITGGTGEFAGASGGGEICYPLAVAGPLMMDGILRR